MLEEFHTTFNLPVCRTFGDCNMANLPLRCTLISEEYSEYHNAKDRINTLDGLGDLTYVAVGTWITLGLMPSDWTGTPNPATKAGNRVELLLPVMAYLTELKKDKLCYKSLYSSETQLYWALENAAYYLNVDLVYLVKLIHESNMTKLWSKDDLVNSARTVTKEDFDFTQTPKGWIVKRKTDGKVVKPSSYKPVDLSKL